MAAHVEYSVSLSLPFSLTFTLFLFPIATRALGVSARGIDADIYEYVTDIYKYVAGTYEYVADIYAYGRKKKQLLEKDLHKDLSHYTRYEVYYLNQQYIKLDGA